MTKGGTSDRHHVLLLGSFAAGNSGNDASLAGMLSMLHRVRPELAPVVVCAAASEAAERFGVQAIPVGGAGFSRGWRRLLDRALLGLPRRAAGFAHALRAARRARALIVPGTGILDDFGVGPFGMPVVVAGWCLAARLAGARVAFVGVGAGPARHPLSRWLFARAAALADFRSFRDAGSRAFVRGLGIDVSRDRVTPDLAFSLPVPSASPAGGGRPRIGLGVMGYYGWRADRVAGASVHAAYVAKVRRIGLALLDRGAQLRLLTGDVADAETAARVLRDLRAARPELPADRITLAPTADLDALMRQIARTDLVIATRFHNVVAALALARPVVSIGYADKNEALLASVGLGANAHSIESFDPDRVLAQADALLAAGAPLGEELAARVAGLRAALAAQETRLHALLGSRSDLELPSRGRTAAVNTEETS